MWAPDRRVVGWIKKSEWESVYKELYSNDTHKQVHAVGRISVWKSRVLHKLSTSIECTCGLIQAVIEDQKAIKLGNIDERDGTLRMTYAMALVRFVNLITERLQTRTFAQPVHVLAETLGLPEWLVNLRHDATHGSLPQVNLLRSGTQLALAWLKREYWEAQNEWNVKDQVSSSSPAVKGSQLTNNVEDLLVTYMQQQFQAIENSSDSLTKKEKISMRLTLQDLEKAATQKRDLVFDSLLQEGYMIPSDSQLEALGFDKDDLMKGSNLGLPETFVQLWRDLLTKLHSVQLSESLIYSFLQEAAEADYYKMRIIYGWVYLILQSISNPEGQVLLKKSLIFGEATPRGIDWHALLHHITDQPDEYSKQLLPCILSNLTPPLSEDEKNAILSMTDVILAESEEDMETDDKDSNVYSVDSLPKIEAKPCKQGPTMDSLPSPNIGPCWELCTEPINWSEYPLGECPGVPLEYTNLEILQQESTRTCEENQEEIPITRENAKHLSAPTQWTDYELKSITDSVELL